MKVHNGQRPYKCCDCAGAFRSKGDLRSHRKLHVDDRPFICGKCGKTFKTYQYLVKHLKKCNVTLPSDDSAADDSLPQEVKTEPDSDHELTTDMCENESDDSAKITHISICDIEAHQPMLIHFVDCAPMEVDDEMKMALDDDEKDSTGINFDLKFCDESS